MIEKRELVIPGQLLADGDYIPGDNTYESDKKIYASKLGLFDIYNKRITVVPIKSCYVPKKEDYVIGRVTSSEVFGWLLDINSPYPALLQSSDLSGGRYRDRDRDRETSGYSKLVVGDLVRAKIAVYDRTRDPLLTTKERGLGKIASGKIIKISPAKIPRLIGKEGSMISMLKKETSCQIFAGRNGIIHISSQDEKNEKLALWAIEKIEREAHTSGLTDRLFEEIKKRKGN
jgi:exosome complex component RRP4